MCMLFVIILLLLLFFWELTPFDGVSTIVCFLQLLILFVVFLGSSSYLLYLNLPLETTNWKKNVWLRCSGDMKDRNKESKEKMK